MTEPARYFEDYPVGAVFTGGAAAVSEADIVDFARRFDPQDMHTDPEAAKRGPLGGLIASGWHTAAIAMRLIADHYLSREANLPAPGVDELRWIRPVRPGDVLSVRVTVLTARRSQSKPDRGVVTSLVELLNQNGEPVMTMKPVGLVRCRS